MNMSLKSIVSTMGAVTLAIAALGASPSSSQAHTDEMQGDGVAHNLEETQLAQNSNLSAANIDNLPNGTYFYGEVSDPRQGGSDYAVFNKNGQTVTGMKYTYQTGNITCFEGMASNDIVTDATVASTNEAGFGDPNAPSWIFSSNETIALNGYQRLSTTQIPETVSEEFANCRQLNYTAKR